MRFPPGTVTVGKPVRFLPDTDPEEIARVLEEIVQAHKIAGNLPDATRKREERDKSLLPETR